MRCTGLSVVRGTAISSFNVDVIDVVAGDASSDAPEDPRARVGPGGRRHRHRLRLLGLPDPVPRRLGRAADRGAISETVNEYGNKTVLATPIEQMLGEPVTAPRGARRLPAHGRPLSSALSATGLSPRVRRVLTRAARRPRRVRCSRRPPARSAPSPPVAGARARRCPPRWPAATSAWARSAPFLPRRRQGAGLRPPARRRRHPLAADAGRLRVLGDRQPAARCRSSPPTSWPAPGTTSARWASTALSAVTGRVGAAAAPPPGWW